MKKIFVPLLFLISLAHYSTSAQNESMMVIAGTGKAGFVDGKLAELNKPIRLAPYKNNSIIFADINNHAVRICTFDGVVTTITGGPDKKGHQDGPASKAKFNSPHGVAYDELNDVIYVAEAGSNLIRTITKSDDGDFFVNTLAGISEQKGFKDAKIDSALFNSPHAVILAKGGGVYVVDIGNARVRLIKDGNVTTIAGSGMSGNTDGKPEEAAFKYAIDITSDGDNIFVADAGSNVIRKIHPNSFVTTLHLKDTLNTPHGIALDDDNNIYIADMGSHRILRINSEGEVISLAGTGTKGSEINELNKPAAVLVHNNYLWIADLDNHQIKAIKIK